MRKYLLRYRTLIGVLSGTIILSLLVGLLFQPQSIVFAQPILTVTPITWNVIGLDSNDPINSGPENFPVGVRVCNTATLPSDTANNVAVQFVWDSANAGINLRPGSVGDGGVPVNIGTLANSACEEVYFEVTVTRNPAPYDTTRRYHIVVDSDETTPISTDTPRELYVEHLISQSRNATTDVLLDGKSIDPGGTMALVVGETYTIRLEASTATNGYEQIETFINFPNTIFQINSVATTYSAPPGATSNELYGDGCTWENDPNSPNYRSCLSTGKLGGTVTVEYNVTIISGGGTTQTLNSLIYDFSGSSYHYNADYEIGARIAVIIDPSTVTIAKAFNPNPTSAGGTTTLTFTLSNPNAVALTGLNFTDTFPTSPGAMVTATPASFSSSGCGTPSVEAPIGAGTFNAGAVSVAVSTATVPANGSCTISVNVTPPTASPPDYTNTTSNLLIGTVDTGNSASDGLTVNNTPPPPPPICGYVMADWPVPGTATDPPDLAGGIPTTIASDVPSAVASAGAGINSQIRTNLGHLDNSSWGSNGGFEPGVFDPTQNNYFQFAIDTQNYQQISLTFWARRTNNGPQDLYVYYGTTGTPPETLKASYTVAGGSGLPAQNTWYPFTTNFLASETSTTGVTYFYIYGANSGNNNPGSDLFLDEITFTGCKIPDPPTITKSFSPDPIAVNGVSTLIFTLTNPNPSQLTGVTFTDNLPAGLQVAATPNASTACGGAPTWAPAAASTTLSFGSPTGATVPASSSCTVQVDITATTAGPHTNVSGYISSTETGTNNGAGGSATDTLTAVLPPVIAKQFAPDPILAGGVSTLTFTITNPNPSDALAGVAFSDDLPDTLLGAPGNMVVYTSPNVSYSADCGAGVFAPALAGGEGAVTFSGGTIPGGGTCTVTVDVTAPTNGTYNNTSGNVSHIINAATVNGNTASDSLSVVPPSPAINLLKQVGSSATGPWSSYLATTAGSNVYYKFTVENSGDVPLNLTAPVVTDIVGTVNTLAAACTWLDYLANPIALPATLPVAVAANDAHIITCVTSFISAASGSNQNTATATGTYLGTPYTDTSSATYATTGLTIVKSANETYFTAAGDVLTYSYVVTNTGSAQLAGPVTVTDNPATSETCDAVDTVGDLDNWLDPGEAVNCSASYTVQATDVSNGSVTNVASASADGVTSPTDNATVYLAALTIDKDTSTPNVGPNGTVTYSIEVVNTGGVALTNFQVMDSLPDFNGAGAGKGYSIASVTAPGYTTNAGFDGDADVNLLAGTDTLAVGATATITVTLNLSGAITGTTYENTATTSTSETGSVDDDGTVAQDPGTPAGQDPEDDEDVTVEPIADLAITKTDGVGSVNAGGSTTYTVRVTNNGPTSVTGAVLSDAAAAGLSKTGVVCSGTPGQCVTPPTVGQLEGGAFALPALASGEFYEIEVTATVTAGSGSVTNTATVAPPAGVTDPNNGDNSASDTDTVNVVGSALTIDKDTTTPNVNRNGTVVYSIVVVNTGGSPLTNFQVTDALPFPGGQFSVTSVNASVTSGTITDNFPGYDGSGNINLLAGTDTLAVGATATIMINVQLVNTTLGTYDNTATADTVETGPLDDNGLLADDPGTPGGGADPESDEDVNVSGLFDPPSGRKVLNAALLPELEWRMVWINNSNTAAINVQVTDSIPPGTTYVPGSLSCVTTGASTSATVTGATAPLNPGLPASWCAYDPGPGPGLPRIQWQGTIEPDPGATDEATANNEVIITFRVTVPDGLNQVNNQGSSLTDINDDGDFQDDDGNAASEATSNVVVWRRGGVGGGAPGDPGTLPTTGYPPGLVTALPAQPEELNYLDLGDVWLEIPALGVKLPIVGVPRVQNGEWDVTWLWSQAGWLQGTAFPTWQGNSVLTGHVYLSNGLPGPFISLARLRWGDLVIVHAFGDRYIYEVRSNEIIRPNDVSVLGHEERAWLTLLTCMNYREHEERYASRIAVQAVLVKVAAE